MSQSTEPHPFVAYLHELVEDQAALAALRRGLDQPPGAAPEMHRYVMPRLPDNLNRRQEEACYLVAALFGLHPRSTQEGNLGSHFAATLNQANPKAKVATERRFSNLLSAHSEDLPFYLRQAISFLRSKDEQPVNWSQLLQDIFYWDHPDRIVQKHWAAEFWRRRRPEAQRKNE